MSHPIIEGPVKVLKVVTPGAYWIRCEACKGPSRVPSSIKHKPVSSHYHYHLQGDKVFVQDEDGFFYRGTVCGRRAVPARTDASTIGVPAYWKYVVQLTDTFQVKDFDHDNVFPSYGESSAACGSAHLVSLYHVLPQMPPSSYGRCVKMDSDEHKAFERSVVDWDRYVALMPHLPGRVSFVQCKTIKGSIYGKLSMSPPLIAKNGTLCDEFSEYLHFEKLVVPVTFRFEHTVQALMSNPLTDCSKLLVAFDPFGSVTFKTNPTLTPEPPAKPREPIEVDFDGFRVHPEDVLLHQGLIKDCYYTNIIYKHSPPERDTIIRYLSPDGNVVLGTVLNLNLFFVEELGCNGYNARSSLHASSSLFRSNVECPKTHYPNKMFEKLPPDSNEPEEEPPCDFDEALRKFHAAGGLFAERLLPYPFSPAVERIVLHLLNSVGVESLHDWQTLCLATFCCRKNLLVVGSKSLSKLITATVSALAWMTYVSDSKPDSIHPQLIIFLCDFERADKTAAFCKKLTNFRVIVSTSSFISKKQKEMAMHGCDVLITTPSNWLELVSQNVFDYSRLDHVVFDEFNRLYQIYTEDLMGIFETLGSFSTRRIQTVCLANRWGALISDKRIFRKVDFPTLCITDAFRACCYLKLTPAILFVQNDNCTRNLENFVFEKGAKKRLLICKNEEEGMSILDKIPSSEPIQFIHENIDEDTALKKVMEWDNSVACLLVCTDACFEKLDFMKCVTFEVMISWMTNSLDVLSRRFNAFNRDIRSTRYLSVASAYVLCDCEQLEQLLLIKDISCDVCFINGTLDAHLNRVSILAEREKLTNICRAVLMFGKCSDFPVCPFRHVFRPDDDPEVLNVRHFLNVDILKVHNAFRYSVRVKEIVSNTKFSKKTRELISKLEEIENELERSPRKLCPSTVNVGQMVGASIDRDGVSVLRRLSVKSVPAHDASDLYILSVVDYEEPELILPLSQLFVLPEKVVRYPKDVVDLYISGLLPVDFKYDWQNDTHFYITAGLSQISDDSNFLAGRVQIIFANRSVLVDSMFCFRECGSSQKSLVSISSSEFGSLKELILESGYCVRNEAHLATLVELVNAVVPDGPGTSPVCLPLNPEGRYGCRSDLPSDPVPAVVSSYDDPGLFYVQLVDDLEKLSDFQEELSSSLKGLKRKLPLIAIDELCAIHYNGAWNRAMIFDILGDLSTSDHPIHVLFVDYGDSCVDAQPHELYVLPEHLASVPFFAIQCELAGIRPTCDGEWHEKAVKEFRNHVRTTEDEMENLTVEFRGNRNDEPGSKGYWKYLVILKHRDTGLVINSELGRRGLADFDRTFRLLDAASTKHRSKKTVVSNFNPPKNGPNL